MWYSKSSFNGDALKLLPFSEFWTSSPFKQKQDFGKESVHGKRVNFSEYRRACVRGILLAWKMSPTKERTVTHRFLPTYLPSLTKKIPSPQFVWGGSSSGKPKEGREARPRFPKRVLCEKKKWMSARLVLGRHEPFAIGDLTISSFHSSP